LPGERLATAANAVNSAPGIAGITRLMAIRAQPSTPHCTGLSMIGFPFLVSRKRSFDVQFYFKANDEANQTAGCT
jgi:hypothetical protein